MRNLATVFVSRRLLAEMLFPAWTEIKDIRPVTGMFVDDAIEFLVENDKLPEVPEGGKIPHLQVRLERIDKQFFDLTEKFNA